MNLDTDENIKEVFDLIIEKLPEEGRMYQNLFEVVEETKLVDSSNP
jgi:predicted RNase H-like HicB family nuclease